MRNGSAYEYLFTEEGSGASAELLRHDAVNNYRVKTITSGPLVRELEIFPIFPAGKGPREKREYITSEAQRKVNLKNSINRFLRQGYATFGAGDLHVTVTFDGFICEEQATRDVRNYLRRLARWRKRHGLPPLQCVGVVEYCEDDGRGKAVRLHHHLIMSAMDRDVAESIWRKGYSEAASRKGFVNADRLQPNEDGIKGLLLYMQKDPYGRKRWYATKNLKQPVITISDKKLSKPKAARIAADIECDGKAIIEKFHPDYMVKEITVRRSDYVAGAYMYVQLRKRGYPDNRTPENRAHMRAHAPARVERRIE